MRDVAIGEDDAPHSAAALFVAIGLVEGAIWWWASPFAAGLSAISIPKACAIFGASGAALAARFAWTGRDRLRLAGIAAGFGITLIGVTAWVWAQLRNAQDVWTGEEQRVVWWALGAPVFLYLVGPFAQAYQESGRARLQYRAIFDHSWNNLFVGGIALALAGALWALLGISGALFRIIGVDAFAELFGAPGFAYPFTFAAFGYGLHLGMGSTAVIRALRRITFALSRAVLPAVSAVVLLFLLALPLTGIEPLWDSGSTTPLILGLLALFVIPLNAVFEDGTRQVPYGKALRWGVRAASFSLPAYAAIALYSVRLRIEQYGLSPDRIFALIFVAIVAVYALGYSLAAARSRGGWMHLLRPVNLLAAITAGIVSLLVQLPPLDPMRLSAESQLSRLLSGRTSPEDFDFESLGQLGHYGAQAIERLSSLESHPAAERIRTALVSVREGGQIDAGWIRIAPANASVDTHVLQAIRHNQRWLLRGCSRETCLLTAADLDGDGFREYCVFNSRRSPPQCSGPDGNWLLGASLRYLGPGAFPDIDAIARALDAEPLELKPSRRIRVLEVGSGELLLLRR